jgi:hypothetical protein
MSRQPEKTGRNQPCPRGSGRKPKRCDPTLVDRLLGASDIQAIFEKARAQELQRRAQQGVGKSIIFSARVTITTVWKDVAPVCSSAWVRLVAALVFIGFARQSVAADTPLLTSAL